MHTASTVRRLTLCVALAAVLSPTASPSVGASEPTGDIEGGYSVDLGGSGRTVARLVVPTADCVSPGTIAAVSQALHHQANGWVTVGGASYSGCAPDGAGGLIEDYHAVILGPSGTAIIDFPVAPQDVILVRIDVAQGNGTVTIKNLTAGWHRRDSGPVPPSDFYTVGADTSTGGVQTTIRFRNNRIDGTALSEAGATPNPPADPCGLLSDVRNQLNFSVSIVCTALPDDRLAGVERSPTG